MSTDLLPVPYEVEVTDTSWRPTSDLTREQWEAAGLELQRVARSVNWLLGDWILYGEQRYGETYSDAIDLTAMEYDTLKNVVWVARNVLERSRRRDLSWSHHQAVAALPEGEQEMWLREAVDEGYTVARLRSRLAASRAEDPEPEAMPKMTHCARITFKLAADSDEHARELLAAHQALLERKGVVVTSSRVEGL